MNTIQGNQPEFSSTESQGYSSHTFRNPIQPDSTPTPSVRVSERTETVGDAPQVRPNFSEYQDIEGTPFSADYFGLKGIYKELTPTDVKNLTKVEEYVRARIASGECSDNYEAAKACLADLESRSGTKEHNSPFFKLERIVELLPVTSNSSYKEQVQKRVDPTVKIYNKKVRTLRSVVVKLLEAI